MFGSRPDKVKSPTQDLLPFMIRTVIVLAGFFFIITLVQLVFLHRIILANPKVNVESRFNVLTADSLASYADRRETVRLQSLFIIETGLMEKRFHQISMLLLSRLWVNYIGFITGMILAIVGAAFILGKLRISLSELSAKVSGNDVTLKTTSPGLVLCVLGCILMMTTLVVHHDIHSTHNSIYLHESSPVFETDSSISPPLPPSPYN